MFHSTTFFVLLQDLTPITKVFASWCLHPCSPLLLQTAQAPTPKGLGNSEAALILMVCASGLTVLPRDGVLNVSRHRLPSLYSVSLTDLKF